MIRWWESSSDLAAVLCFVTEVGEHCFHDLKRYLKRVGDEATGYGEPGVGMGQSDPFTNAVCPISYVVSGILMR